MSSRLFLFWIKQRSRRRTRTSDDDLVDWFDDLVVSPVEPAHPRNRSPNRYGPLSMFMTSTVESIWQKKVRQDFRSGIITKKEAIILMIEADKKTQQVLDNYGQCSLLFIDKDPGYGLMIIIGDEGDDPTEIITEKTNEYKFFVLSATTSRNMYIYIFQYN